MRARTLTGMGERLGSGVLNVIAQAWCIHHTCSAEASVVIRYLIE
jgi:hypothetical protein